MRISSPSPDAVSRPVPLAAAGRATAALTASIPRFLLACWLAMAAGWAFAADGVVIALVGSVTAQRQAQPGTAGATRALRTGDELSQGDTVRTGSDGRAQIRFSDGGLVSLQPLTEFRIDEYRLDGEQQRSFFSLVRGAIRSATGAIGKRDRDNYRLRTPTATIGIRGTEFLAEETVCDPACAPGPRAGLRVSVTEGRIAVTTSAGTLEVGEGQAAEVESPTAMPRLASAGPVLGTVALASASTTSAPAAGGGATGSATPAAVSAPFLAPTSAAGLAAATTKYVSGSSTLPKIAPYLAKGATTDAAGAQAAAADTADTADATETAADAAGAGASIEDLAALVQPLTYLPIGDSIGYNVRRDESGNLIALGGLLPVTPVTPETPETPETRLLVSVVHPRIPGSAALQFDSRDVRVAYDDAQALQSIGTCPSFCLSRGSASAVETGFEAEVVSWGRWTGGVATLQTGESATREVNLSANQGIHYLIGVPSETVPTQGTFSYGLIGATRPTIDNGSVAPGSFTGTAAVVFGPGAPARIGLDGQIAIGGATIGFATIGGASNPGLSQLTTGAQYGFSGALDATVTGGDPAGCARTGCTVDLRGGLFGPEAARLGYTYTVGGNSASSVIGGAAVFGKQ